MKKCQYCDEPCTKDVKFAPLPAALIAAMFSMSFTAPVSAQTGFFAGLKGALEVPVVSSTGIGLFTASSDEGETVLNYSLFYQGLQTPVQQAHIHMAQPGVNGSVVLFLCTNLGNGPEGTPACPEDGGTVQGTLTSADVTAVTGQGIGEGDFAKVIKAIREGNAYANVHTDDFPPGEIRGNIISGP